MKKILLLAVTLALLSTSALAFDPSAPADITTPLAIALDSPVLFNQTGIIDNFYHKYTFTLPQSVFSISAVSLQFPGISQLNNFTASLYKADDLTQLFEVTGESLIEKRIDLLAGDYFLAIRGTPSGLIGGSYTGVLAATKPVPLPGAALFLGAGVLGLIGLRRRNLHA